jgi:hypothetical protein
MIRSLIILIYILLSLPVFGQDRNLNNFTRKNYPDSLIKLVKIITEEREPGDSLLYFCIPEDSSEAILLVEIDYWKNEKFKKSNFDGEDIYFTIVDNWKAKCLDKNVVFLKAFIRYSEFVDGYYAEDYFIKISEIIDKIGNEFCQVLEDIQRDYKKRLLLDEYVIEKCK